EGTAPRLTGGDGVDGSDGRQQNALPRSRLRPREGFGPDLAVRALSYSHRGERETAGEVAGRVRVLCQGAAEAAQLRLGWHWKLATSLRRLFRAGHGT